MSQPREDQATLLGQIGTEIAPEAGPALDFILTHIKAICIAFGGLVLLVVCIATYSWFSAKALEENRVALGMIVATEQGAAKVEKLEAFAKAASGSLVNSAWYEMAKAAFELQDYDRAAQGYEALAAQGGKSAVIAVLGLAQIRLKQGRPSDAVEALLPLVDSTPELETVVLQTLAASALEAKDYPQALAAYESLHELLQRSNMGDGMAEYFAFRIESLKQQMEVQQ